MMTAAKIIQGNTDSTALNVGINLTKGALGGLAVYLLSKTSRPGTAIAAASATSAYIGLTDFYDKGGKPWTYIHGITPFYRAMQVAAAYYGYQKFGSWCAVANLLEPLALTGLGLAMTNPSDWLDITSTTWGIQTLVPAKK
jgi:hypothetical protein